jgi:hypothetical protein
MSTSNAYLKRSEEAKRLSALYCEIGGLPPKSKDDAMRIAIATVSECDAILSRNFKHLHPLTFSP